MTKPLESTLNLGKQGSWLGIIALVAIVGGVLLPQFLPEPATLPAPPEKKASKGDDLKYEVPTAPPVTSPQTLLMRLAIGSAVVTGIGWGALWAVRRWGSPKMANGSTPGSMQVLETVSLGNRCLVHLVAVANQRVLIGTDAMGVKTIVPLPENFASMVAADEEVSPATSPASI